MENSNVPPNHSTVREATEGKTYEAIHPDHHHITNDDDSYNDTVRNSEYGSEKGAGEEVKGGIAVQRAEAEFAQLSKELSRTSQISRRMSRIQSHHSQKNQTLTDVEKGVDGSSISSEEQFDLEKTLRGNRDEEEAAGIKSKRIGVAWDGLTVSGVGGVKNYVKVSSQHLNPRADPRQLTAA